MLHLVKKIAGKIYEIVNVVWLWSNFGFWTIFSVIGATIIVAGIYLVLWGKSQDQLRLKSDGEKVVPTA